MGLGGADHLEGVEHLAVERKRQAAVEQAPAPLTQGILIAAEVGQAVHQKVLEQCAALAPGDRPGQGAGIGMANGADARGESAWRRSRSPRWQR